MPVTIGSGDGLVTLPDDTLWLDEFGYSKVVQQADYAVDGTLIIQESVMKAGRNITLDCGWVTRAVVNSIQTQADLANTSQALVLGDGRTFTVRYGRAQPPSGSLSAPGTLPFKASPVVGYSDPDDSDKYELTLNLFMVTS